MALRQQLGLIARWSQQSELQQQQVNQKLFDTTQQLSALSREHEVLKTKASSKVSILFFLVDKDVFPYELPFSS